MAHKEKLIKKLLSQSRGFSFGELETLLGYFGYEKSTKGKTSGSRVIFLQTG